MSRPHWALLLAALIYGLFYIAIKILVTEINPWEIFTLRHLLATPLLFGIERLFFKTRIQSLHDLIKITGLGLLGITLVQSTIVVGLRYTSVFHAGFIVGTAPIATLLLSVLMRQERLTWPKVLGIGIAFIGLVLLLSTRSNATHLPVDYRFGDSIVLINIIGWSLFLILSRPLLQRYPAFSLTAYAFTLSGILTLPFFTWALHRIPGSDLSPSGWLWMAFVVLFATILTYFLNFYALSQLDASTVSLYVFLQPVVTTFLAQGLLHETVTMPMMLEGILILIGVSIATESYRVVQQWLLRRNAS